MTDTAPADKKVAVVTGGGQGIGFATAEALYAAGFQIVIADRDGSTDKQVRAAMPDAVFLLADVVDENDVARMAEEVVARFGRWDVLVNNAGRWALGSVVSTTVQLWDEMMDVCAKSAWLCTRAAVGPMRSGGGGSIINISSVVAHGADGVNQVAYVAAKSAVIGLTIASAQELGVHGIRVNAVSPGTIETRAMTNAANAEELRENRSKRAVLGRVGRPEEIGQTIAYLASDASSFMTGHVLVVDGGRTDKI
jgi:3-oxoacyl-[acyl-carrier protein] reductase